MTIFITGATGFLGSYLLKTLLEQQQQSIVALIRPHKIPAMERIHGSLKACHASPNVLDLASEMVTCLEGDITQPHLGLSPPVFKRLGENISSVWHVAGVIQLEANYKILEAVNLHGTQRILELLTISPDAQLFHVSTAFVAGKRSGTIYEEELLHHLGFENPYEAFKSYTELLLHFWAEQQKRSVKIFRPSILVTNTPSLPGYASHPLAVVARAFQTALTSNSNKINQASLRIPSAPDAYLNLVPVTYAAQAMLIAAQQSMSSHIQTYHVVNPVDVPVISLIDTFSKILSVPLSIHSTIPSDPSPLERRLLRATRRFLPYHFHRRRFSDTQLQAVLPSTICCPEVTKPYLMESLSEFRYPIEATGAVS